MGGGGGSDRRRRSGSSNNQRDDGGGPVVSPPEDDNPEEGEYDDDDDCFIDIITELDSPNPEALSAASEDDIYPIEIRDGRPCVIDDEDRVIGSITGDLGLRLRECIEAGYEYQAQILEIDGRSCVVRVSNKCRINTTTMLASPNPEPLGDLLEGDTLTVDIQDGSLCVIDDADRVVGSITEPWIESLMECIEAGYSYSADILTIDGGDCEVQITNERADE